LDIEGTVNGNYDSLITVPLPTPPPSISNLSPTGGLIGTAVTINGSNFGATQGTSTVTFNGTAATPTSWTDTSIVAPAPSGTTTGPVVVTARGQASNGVTFTLLTAGSIAGTITRTSDGAPISGALVEALQAGVVKNSATTVANGSYTMTSIITGTYDVRVSAAGYQTKLQSSIAVTANTTTTVNDNLAAIAAGGDINYIYDESGRLISVVTASETVTYTYDSAGNLLATTRQNTNLPSIIEFDRHTGHDLRHQFQRNGKPEHSQVQRHNCDDHFCNSDTNRNERTSRCDDWADYCQYTAWPRDEQHAFYGYCFSHAYDHGLHSKYRHCRNRGND
jgi:YD repeat-containing protein